MPEHTTATQTARRVPQRAPAPAAPPSGRSNTRAAFGRERRVGRDCARSIAQRSSSEKLTVTVRMKCWLGSRSHVPWSTWQVRVTASSNSASPEEVPDQVIADGAYDGEHGKLG